MANTTTYFPRVSDIELASKRLKEVITPTPLTQNAHFSQKYDCTVFLKREDLQLVRSYKIRGAYNKIRSLDPNILKYGIVCASAGNHAQGVALSCNKLNIMGSIYMPVTTPRQKIEAVSMFGGKNVDIVLIGDTFDEANHEAKNYSHRSGKTFIPPFDDEKIIEGQGTIGLELVEECVKSNLEPFDYVFIPIGGGGLASGVGAYIKQVWPECKVIGVEPAGAASMKASIDAGYIVDLEKINNLVDGAAVKKPGKLTYNICKEILDDIIAVPEGAVCSTIIELYNRNATVVEPAGALSIAALRFYSEQVKGKRVACIVSGSNNDITRMEEFREQSLVYEGLKHYFIVNFPQRAGAILKFIRDIVGPNDNLVYIQYIKKNNKEEGPALIGIEVAYKEDFDALIRRMEAHKISYEYINQNDRLYEMLI